jgi:hypothetical protein
MKMSKGWKRFLGVSAGLFTVAGGALFFICVLLGSRVKAAFAARHRLVEQSVSIDRFTLGGLTLDEKTAVASD